MIKYQYITTTQEMLFYDRRMKDLCIAIATDIQRVDLEYSVCVWTVSFKNPNDQFSKKDARDAISINTSKPGYSGRLVLNKNYTRNEILSKILMQLCINENDFSSTYRQYIRYLITTSSFLDNLYI